MVLGRPRGPSKPADSAAAGKDGKNYSCFCRKRESLTLTRIFSHFFSCVGEMARSRSRSPSRRSRRKGSPSKTRKGRQDFRTHKGDKVYDRAGHFVKGPGLPYQAPYTREDCFQSDAVRKVCPSLFPAKGHTWPKKVGNLKGTGQCVYQIPSEKGKGSRRYVVVKAGHKFKRRFLRKGVALRKCKSPRKRSKKKSKKRRG